MKDNWKMWIDEKIHLLSTPLGVGISISSFVAGLLLGKFILTALKGF